MWMRRDRASGDDDMTDWYGHRPVVNLRVTEVRVYVCRYVPYISDCANGVATTTVHGVLRYLRSYLLLGPLPR